VIRDELLKLYGGNEAAADFVLGFWALMECWDDLIDRDKPFDDDAINRAIMWALFDMQDNAFYRANPFVLRAALYQAIASWQASITFERSGDRDKVEQAYFMRCSAYDVFSTVALLTGGRAKQREAVEYFRALAPGDTLADYVREHMGE
jgi:hypothetical protein